MSSTQHDVARRRIDDPTTDSSGPRDGSAAHLAVRAAMEVAIIGVLFALYNVGRMLIAGQETVAKANGRAVHALEQSIRLPSEAALQELAASVPHGFELANRYYMALHFPVMIAFLVWGFVRRPRVQYLWARNLAVIMTLLALVIHVAYPLAPPRMFPEMGFTDTMSAIGPSPYEAANTMANQYAAMPSLHIGWALLVAMVVWRTGPRVVGILAVAHAVVTVTVVVITANHWWLDGLVAAGLLLIGLLLLPAPGRCRLRWPSGRPSGSR